VEAETGIILVEMLKDPDISCKECHQRFTTVPSFHRFNISSAGKYIRFW